MKSLLLAIGIIAAMVLIPKSCEKTSQPVNSLQVTCLKDNKIVYQAEAKSVALEATDDPNDNKFDSCIIENMAEKENNEN